MLRPLQVGPSVEGGGAKIVRILLRSADAGQPGCRIPSRKQRGGSFRGDCPGRFGIGT